jgi:hypothetical protein
MIVRRKITLFDIAQYFGLDIEYSSDLPAGVHGCLEPGEDPRFILINPNQPAFEQQFTIAHELAHLVLHHNSRRQHHHHWILTRKWRWSLLARFCRGIRLSKVVIINRECQADIWALCLLIHLGDVSTLNIYLGRHPKKKIWYSLALLVCVYKAIPKLFQIWLKRPLNLARPA